ncbi:MAG: amidase [Candidatus Wallbacteria bacterium HGW-Wallbacteria-1]|jgi:Asp-tRNA(Asn)/Glu-tRNA(Gln) amidotransferase A subunit family amidase|uniref:Amidase n=1 Tax=Candidatus Wallbacteria bacterium HGW-Wallbacteria-1 TaxID=2013854 RepID=A0A2N1PNT1_9BACT|nr:MAG: amidase [Candidatus Wallbacteria bacterium HGW-Wallbacteria-1]
MTDSTIFDTDNATTDISSAFIRHNLPEPSEIKSMSVPEMQNMIRDVHSFIVEREPEIKALLNESERLQRMLSNAAEICTSWSSAPNRPPLFGLIAGIKDIYHLEGFETGAGSNLPTSELTGPEQGAVSRLRDAGALFLGKTVTTEFAWSMPGETRNPIDPSRTPGGSSSGSAAAVALGYCHLALGTQTVGSVIRPAAFCGVWGFKPSYGRIPSTGLIPFSPSVDHPGLLAGTISTLTLGASVLCDHWNHEICNPMEFNVNFNNAGIETDFDADIDSLPTLVIPAGPYFSKAGSETRWNVESGASILMESGIRVLEIPFLEDMEEICTLHRAIIARELHDVHRDWYSRYSKLYRAGTVSMIEEGARVSDKLYQKALDERFSFRERINETLADLEGPAGAIFISPPTIGPAPLGLESTGDPVMNLPWTFGGVPSLAMPWGDVEGLPLGLQFTAPFMSDEKLLKWGRGFWKLLSRAD